jgi:hypothetical protein
MKEYEQKAQDFLRETGTEIKIKYLKNDFYFDDDKEKRDIYEVELKRGDRTFKFKYGNSLVDSGLILYVGSGGIKRRTNHKGFSIPKDIREQFINAKTTAEKRKAKLKLKYWFEQNHFSLSGLKYEFEQPRAYDILFCLQKYEVGTFEGFCSEFGYNTDSKKAEKTYKAVKNEYENLERLYSEREFEKMREI